MTSTPPKGDMDGLETKLLNDPVFQHILKFAPQSQRELMTYELARYFSSYVFQCEIEILQEVWNRTQPSIVPEGTEPDELGKWLLSEIKDRKEEV